ncbi:MerR family transcriptional regulator [Lactiplantibacillus mudanjiangensis]|uniref:MerR family transcriptional regulator [Lactobacillus paraplantarum] n=1 Tax=Lactiplantibacillus mudanjiangensis TaxID=1296538 RepID=A0A660E577_9LACO|nr:MerR family transcriptional regulator [Lactiplantibacillus mudanjiangensis]VDG20008.1 MerR family transcriptional regulator [Lactobacillus paraplantarum] [Lactiplantibacillus mudanjiangensis]VDG26168.1 MerR family transcriptional regulator [Lactobacillus paraplantarum] [Lactiplantibacillus mudanjiangensis]VDG27321.1 MerR family transcriptional regulator [Lactobacillus paraplantarum] [Lactiplantibacillus mudanjiangensis]VDG33402.1 MerR family transcriptional regulator [Lactobacillus paraplant
MPPYFTIGQLADLFDMKVPTLRYYDELGLLKPAKVDPHSHYRYYSTAQFERLSTIRYFRALGVGLPAIADFFAAREIPKLKQLLKTQQAQVQQQLTTLQAIDQRLTNRLAQLDQAEHLPLNVVQTVTLPPRPSVYLRQNYTPQADIELVIAKLRERYALSQQVFLGKIALTLSATALKNAQFDHYDGILLLFEPGDQLLTNQQVAGGTYLQLAFAGTHQNAAPAYQQLLASVVQNDWQLNGAAIETALIDYGITDDVSQSVTLIQLPVRKSA